MREKLIETLMTTLYELRTKVFKKYDQKQMLSVLFFFLLRIFTSHGLLLTLSLSVLHIVTCLWRPTAANSQTLFPLDTKKSVFRLKCDRDPRCFHVQVFQTSPPHRTTCLPVGGTSSRPQRKQTIFSSLARPQNATLRLLNEEGQTGQ